MVLANPHLLEIERDSEMLGDRQSMICLDRNERVTAMDPAVFRDVLSRLTPEDLTRYPDPASFYHKLSEATGLPVDHFSVTAGSDGAIRRTFQAFVRPGDRILVPDPTYAMYGVYARLFQAQVSTVPYGADLSFDLDRFLAAIRPGLRLVAVANPGQPTGSGIPLAGLRRIVDAARRVDAVCLIDEAYHPFYPETALPLVPEFDNLVVARTFSKAAGLPGIRLGYAVARPPLRHGIDAVRGNCEVNSLALAVGCYVLDNPGFNDAYRRDVEAGRAVLIAGARDLGFAIPSCYANFQVMHVPVGLEPSDIVAGLARRHYRIRGSYPHPALRRSIRVSLDGPMVMRGFVEALAATLAELPAV